MRTTGGPRTTLVANLGKDGTMAGSTTETPVLDLLASMTADSLEASSLDAETLMLVRIAALAAVDAPPVSYLLNLRAAGELDIDPERVRGVLAAIAPIVGTARVASATEKIVEALEVAIEIVEPSTNEQERE
jgi:4-carboxymuconolactone decarboxylase